MNRVIDDEGYSVVISATINKMEELNCARQDYLQVLYGESRLALHQGNACDEEYENEEFSERENKYMPRDLMDEYGLGWRDFL